MADVLQRSLDYYELMAKRRTVRKFSTEPIPQEVLDNLVKTAGRQVTINRLLNKPDICSSKVSCCKIKNLSTYCFYLTEFLYIAWKAWQNIVKQPTIFIICFLLSYTKINFDNVGQTNHQAQTFLLITLLNDSSIVNCKLIRGLIWHCIVLLNFNKI